MDDACRLIAVHERQQRSNIRLKVRRVAEPLQLEITAKRLVNGREAE
jgi:hypothetical protein